MPHPTQFENAEEYYTILFHEMTHSTGHSTRLKRREVMKQFNFGSHEYSKEELVAEFGSLFLSS
ncbi:MAG TPA: zincin-like metallopeptidase domain-containing protein, partial [Dehalococcoidia bacterium]|nr:zincin-like metallopeptidase domain-containing protein [Dehalococcoidia bacterium]